VSGNLNFRQITLGNGYTCAVTTDGKAYCWGANRAGQLGNGSREDSLAPVQVARLGAVLGVATGGAHTCAVARELTAHCWGANHAGQLGNGSRTDSAVPVPVAENLTFRTIRTGLRAALTCGVTTDGGVACWGTNDAGRFGNGTTQSSMTPVRIPAP
jgi:alpha-tubulin suppressor-like RCC1 family protein